MKKLIFTATLFITIIFISFLAISDVNKHEAKIIKSKLTKNSFISKDVFAYPKYETEYDDEDNDKAGMEFRVCG